MTEFVDSNVLLRYLTDEPTPLADRAEALIESDTPLVITPHILAEVAHVLVRVYGNERHQVVDVLMDLIQRQNISLLGLDRETATEALALCRPSGRVNFADALLWAQARSASPSRIWSFDRRFPNVGIELREPGNAAP